MSNSQFAMTVVRLVATTVGWIVFVMWLLGCIGLADFQLTFVANASFHATPQVMILGANHG